MKVLQSSFLFASALDGRGSMGMSFSIYKWALGFLANWMKEFEKHVFLPSWFLAACFFCDLLPSVELFCVINSLRNGQCPRLMFFCTCTCSRRVCYSKHCTIGPNNGNEVLSADRNPSSIPSIKPGFHTQRTAGKARMPIFRQLPPVCKGCISSSRRHHTWSGLSEASTSQTLRLTVPTQRNHANQKNSAMRQDLCIFTAVGSTCSDSLQNDNKTQENEGKRGIIVHPWHHLEISSAQEINDSLGFTVPYSSQKHPHDFQKNWMMGLKPY